MLIDSESGDMDVNDFERATARAETAEEALRQISKLLEDWPTMRALSAAGAEKATANKLAARKIIADAAATVEAANA
jgi:hypothetical protein